jgi:hypothetical protein
MPLIASALTIHATPRTFAFCLIDEMRIRA